MSDERKTYGTADHDAPVPRRDFERGLRHLHLSDAEIYDLIIRLSAHVVALTQKLGVTLDEEIPATLQRIQKANADSSQFLLDNRLESKYELEGRSPPCDELLHLCGARCCQMTFALSIQDLDEGVVRWDYGQPYKIRQRASDGFCVHNDPASHGCTVHAQRPGVCRTYDCRNDRRVWLDYEKRIPTPPGHVFDADVETPPIDLVGRIRERELGEMMARSAITMAFPDEEPNVGPPVQARKPPTG